MYRDFIEQLRADVGIDARADMIHKAADVIKSLEYALILMVLQYCTDEDGTLWHQFMSAGESAFAALGITLETNPQVLWDRLEEIDHKEATHDHC